VMLGTGHNPIKHEDCNTLDNYMSDRRRLWLPFQWILSMRWLGVIPLIFALFWCWWDIALMTIRMSSRICVVADRLLRELLVHNKSKQTVSSKIRMKWSGISGRSVLRRSVSVW
jgi:hypothetical protein